MGHQITTPTAPVPSITFKDIPWTFQPVERPEEYDGNLLLNVGVDALREYVVDLREDCRTLRMVLRETTHALASVSVERDRLRQDRDQIRQELRELRRQQSETV